MGHVYASADWHGCGKVANQVLNWLKPDDTLYFLGDAIDRGPDGIEIFEKLINRPNTIFLCGNHEDMLAKAMPYLLNGSSSLYYGEMEAYHWFTNGGDETWKELGNKTREIIIEYRNKIYEMSKNAIYFSPLGHKVILEHAGFTPDNFDYRKGHDPLWDRNHFHDSWSKDKEFENVYLVHGHTPVQYLKFQYGYKTMEPITREERLHKHDWWKSKENTSPQIIRYCNGHKFDIDMCTVVSKKIALLDLDTFEEIYFEEEE